MPFTKTDFEVLDTYQQSVNYSISFSEELF